MSQDDFDAESGAAGAVRVSTGLPFLGLTLSTAFGFWSARMWERREPKVWTPVECENVGSSVRDCSHGATLHVTLQKNFRMPCGEQFMRGAGGFKGRWQIFGLDWLGWGASALWSERNWLGWASAR